MRLFRAAVVLGWYVVLPALTVGYFKAKKKEFFDKIGVVRLGIVAGLFWTMMSLPMKVVLRLVFNTKYVWVTKYISF